MASWKRLLTTSDEGSGNGIDSDTVDGIHAAGFATSSHSHSYLPLAGGTLTDTITVATNTAMNSIFRTAQGTASQRAGGGFYAVGHATAANR